MELLDRLTFARKLLLLMLVPLSLLAYFVYSQTEQAVQLRHDADHLVELAGFGTHVSALVHELQKERGASAGFIGSGGERFGPELRQQRIETDARAADLRGFLAAFEVADFGARVERQLGDSLAALERLQDRRGAIDRQALPLNEALGYYTGLNAGFLDLIYEMSRVSPDEGLAIMTAAYANFLQSKERAGIERAVMTNTFAQDRFAPGMFRRFLNLQTTQQNYMDVFRSLATEAHERLLDETLTGPIIDETERMRAVALERAETGGFAVDPVYWFNMQTQKINLLKTVEDRLAEDFSAAASEVAARADRSLIATLALSVVGTALILLLGLWLRRNLIRQLGGEPAVIADIADHIANGELDTDPGSRAGHGDTGVLGSILSMRDNLRGRITEERTAAQATLRIKTALDCVNTPVMVAGEDNRVIYANDAVRRLFADAAADLRLVRAAFDPDDLIEREANGLLAGLAQDPTVLQHGERSRVFTIEAGVRTFEVTSSPVRDADGERLGTVLEWSDLTESLAEQGRERERIEQERLQAAENTRIRHALDNVSSRVMMADTDLNIVYVNTAAQRLFHGVQADFREALDDFDPQHLVGGPLSAFYNRDVAQSDLVGSLDRRHEGEVTYGGRTLRLVSNPVRNEDGERLGVAIEWADRTGEISVENEVHAIVESAGRGNLRDRVDLDGKDGFFRTLSEGVNRLIDVVDTALADIADVMGRVAQGDLTQTITRDYEGRFGDVTQSINGTVAHLDDLVGKLRASSDTVSNAAAEISAGNNDLSSRTEQNAASLEQTAASLEEMTSTVRNNADNAQQATAVAYTAREQAQSGGESAEHAIQAMGEIHAASKRIAEIIGVIDEIAFQTNLLALNASVEAARAGEQGRGFAVVATEVRNLASRSAEAARQIRDLISDSVVKVDSGSELVNESGQKLRDIVESTKKVADIVAEISAATSEQTGGIEQINETVTSMDEVTQQNAALAEEMSAAAASLDEKAREMQGLIGFFTTRSAPMVPPRVPVERSTPRIQAAAPRPAAPTKAREPAILRTASPSKSASVVMMGTDDDEWEEF
jgi:methyl-accepting chemotaxis protein